MTQQPGRTPGSAMTLRSKLVLSFLLLAVGPLAAIVLYNYVSSIRSLRQAALEENLELVSELSERMRKVRQELDTRVRNASRLPLAPPAVSAPDDPRWQAWLSEAKTALGSAAPFIDSLEFVPETEPSAPEPPEPPAPAAAPEPPAATAALEPSGPLAGVVIRLRTPVALSADANPEVSLEEVEALLETLTEETESAAERIGESAASGAQSAALEAAVSRSAALAGHLAAVVSSRRQLSQKELEVLRIRTEKTRRLLGEEPGCTVEHDGKPVGRLTASISAETLLEAVLALSRRDRDEIPFALDLDDKLYVARREDRERLAAVPGLLTGERANGELPDWVVVRLKDGETGVVYGIARPIRSSLLELQRMAGRNFSFGLGLIALALVGIVPLSRRITSDLSRLSEGAEELARGNLAARVHLRSQDEVGRLAGTFNHMASELAANQERLLEQERRAREGEIERRLLAAENERKSSELEEARTFQLSLLPKHLPEHPALRVAVAMRTATEVGGDYYDFRLEPDGALLAALGDATGHGLRAGTLVTVIKSLFAACHHGEEPAAFLARATQTVRGLELERMAMGLALARFRADELTFAAAGMPPALVYRAATRQVDELLVPGLPLGTLAAPVYRQGTTPLAPGDTVLLLSDGFIELTDADGAPQGYERVAEVFGQVADEEPEAILTALLAEAVRFKGDGAQDDDMTFVVVQRRPVGTSGGATG